MQCTNMYNLIACIHYTEFSKPRVINQVKSKTFLPFSFKKNPLYFPEKGLHQYDNFYLALARMYFLC